MWFRQITISSKTDPTAQKKEEGKTDMTFIECKN